MADELRVERTAIDGLLVVHLPLHGDSRGWFKENWQRAKMCALGLPDFGPVQNNVSYNERVGVTRGLHAEPWDKLVSLATGRILGAWVDLRDGPGFGAVHTQELDPATAVFVPRGVANGYQTLEPHTAYSYLVNDHWSAAHRDRYTFVNVADETLAIPWPIPLAEAELSEADRVHPRLGEVSPVPVEPRRVLVLGGSGQVGRALAARFPEADVLGRSAADLSDPAWLDGVDVGSYDAVVNAAAYTAVDAAESPDGRRAAWRVNALAVAELAAAVADAGGVLVHFSTDYVYDGPGPHREDEPLAPLGVYGQSKAAGDVAVRAAPRHYVVRTSWVVGEGHNFVRTMARLADQGASPQVVNDQVGRLTFADDLARSVRHLLDARAPYGVYHVTSHGDPRSWYDVAAAVFVARGRSVADVVPVTAREFGRGKQLAPRPADSVLALGKIASTGFETSDLDEALGRYLATLPAAP